MTDHLNVISRVYLDDAAPDPNEDGTAPTSLFLPVTEGRPFHTALLDIPSVHHAGVLAGAPRGRTTDIGTFIGTEPDADNHLVFHTEHIDPNGLPHVSAQIRFTETDHSRIATALGFQYQLARSIGSPWLGMNPLFRPAGSSLHVMGTHRMGSDEETSVTNTHGRVHGTENIYLAGNGSIPTRNSCNPTLTTVALALRTADFIAQQTTRSLPTAAVVAEP
ncbi:GMC oxidoreductase [Arthrobacter sp. SD76]|uniref:GMC oxidoreductase n=1 Tax=Arthrobacter sp. SD76 TaxID=3415007 RepID=UPI003C770240